MDHFGVPPNFIQSLSRSYGSGNSKRKIETEIFEMSWSWCIAVPDDQ